MSSYFVIHYRRGPNWRPNRPVSEQPLSEHGRYMKRLHEEGTLLLGGPFTDDKGGMAVVTADDIEEARELKNEDPAVAAGVFDGTVHPWRRVNWAGFEPATE